MRAWTYNSAKGGLEKALYLDETAPPPPKSLLTPNAVLVQVIYMSVNQFDCKLAELGVLARPVAPPPAHPGMDFSGRVVLAGAAAATYRPGQLVYGRIEPNKYGTLAEYVIVKNGDGLAHVPESLEDKMAQLATVGTCGMTALQSIQPYLPENTTDAKVFINGGSGGIGTFGIQIAKALGCHVTVSCSGSNEELCRRLGADEVIDYRTQVIGDVLKSKGKVFCLVVDNVGSTPDGQKDLYTAANAYLKDDGYFVQVGGGASKDQIKALAKRALVPGCLGGGKRRWRMVMTAQKHDDLERIGEWMRAGDLQPVLDETYPFDTAPKAYEKLKTGRSRGKIVVRIT